MKSTSNAQVTKEKTPMMKIRSASSRRGFTLIELAIVLAIAGVLFVGLWRLLAGGNQQIKDSTAATQQEQLITAVKAFLASPEGKDYMTIDSTGAQRQLNAQFGLGLPAVATNGTVCATINIAGMTQPQATVWCNLLPPGFKSDSANAYGQTFSIGIRRDGTTAPGSPPRTYSFMIVTVGGDTIPDSSGGRISAQIGADGGFVYSNQVCAPTPANACGAYGAWQSLLTDYGLATTGGHVASRTFSSPEDNSVMPWLARIFMNGDTEYKYNTMVADLYMGATTTGAAAGTTRPTNVYMTGAATIPDPVIAVGGNINMQGGQIDLAGGYNSVGSMANGALVAAISGSGEHALMSPFVNIDMQNGFIPKLSNAVQIYTRCTATTDPILQTKAGLMYNGNCGYALDVKGDASISNLTMTEAFAEVFFYKSDRRMKNSIEPLKGSLETLMKVEPVSYKLNGSTKTSLGVIAQDIEKIYPDMVTVNGSDGMKAVAYNELIAPMIEAIQELKRQNEDLRSQLNQQIQRQNKLEKDISGKKTAKDIGMAK